MTDMCNASLTSEQETLNRHPNILRPEQPGELWDAGLQLKFYLISTIQPFGPAVAPGIFPLRNPPRVPFFFSDIGFGILTVR